MIIREIKEIDAEEFFNLCKKLDEETQFMILEPGERITTVGEQLNQIKSVLSKDNQTILVAENNGQLIGYIGVYGGRYKRNKHSVYIVIGILQNFT